MKYINKNVKLIHIYKKHILYIHIICHTNRIKKLKGVIIIKTSDKKTITMRFETDFLEILDRQAAAVYMNRTQYLKTLVLAAQKKNKKEQQRCE